MKGKHAMVSMPFKTFLPQGAELGPHDHLTRGDR